MVKANNAKRQKRFQLFCEWLKIYQKTGINVSKSQYPSKAMVDAREGNEASDCHQRGTCNNRN